jgi:hypothetical protein
VGSRSVVGVRLTRPADRSWQPSAGASHWWQLESAVPQLDHATAAFVELIQGGR